MNERQMAWLRRRWIDTLVAAYVYDGWPTKREEARIRAGAADEEAEAEAAGFPDEEDANGTH